MITFNKNAFDRIYEKYLPAFVKLTKDAIAQDVSFKLTVDTKGNIYFSSFETRRDKAGKKVISTHYICQSREGVSDGSQTYYK